MAETLNETRENDEPEAAPVEGEPVEPDEPGVSDDEAAEAEDAEQGDAAPQVEPEPTPEAADENVMDAVFEKATRRAKTYMNALPDILGDAYGDLLLCPRCTDLLPGVILPLAMKPVSDEQRIAVKMSIGELVEPEYKQADDAFVCPKCEGRGKVATGSKVPGRDTGTCLECKGDGWIGPRKNRLDALPPEERAELRSPNGDVPEAKPVQDPWGRLIDDPLYGVMPGFERE